jgi:predicted aspartyl protease
MVDAFVGVSSGRAAALQQAGQPVPAPQRIRALIDTGASGSCVDPMIVTALGIQPTGTVPVCTPTTGMTPVVCNQYDVSILIPAPKGLPFQIATTAVTEHEFFAVQGFHALIGRDILSRCLFIYNGQISLFTLAY